MATFVQGTTFSSGSTTVTTPTALAFTSNVTAGDLIIVAIGWSTSSGTGTATSDSQGNVYTAAGAGTFLPTHLSAYALQVNYAIAKTTGPLTVTITPAGGSSNYNFLRLLIHEYSGWSAYDVATTLDYAGATATASVTTTGANDLVFAWCVDNSGVNSFSSPYAVRETTGAECTGDCLTVGAAGSQSVTCNTAGGGGGMIVASYKVNSAVTQSGAITMGGTAGMLLPNQLVQQFAGTSLAAAAGMNVGAAIQQLGGVNMAAGTTLTASLNRTQLAAITQTASTSLSIFPLVSNFGGVLQGATAGMTIGALVQEVSSVSMAAGAAMTVGGRVVEQAGVAMAASAGLSAAGVRTQLAAVALAGGASLSTTVYEIGTASLLATSGLSVVALVSGGGGVVMVGTARLVGVAAPLSLTGQVTMASLAGLSAAGVAHQIGTLQAAAAASLVVVALKQSSGVVTFHTIGTLSATGQSVSPLAEAQLEATTSLVVAGTIVPIGKAVEPTLEEQLVAVAGLDPILMGATAYMDPVFTTRLSGDSE